MLAGLVVLAFVLFLHSILGELLVTDQIEIVDQILNQNGFVGDFAIRFGHILENLFAFRGQELV